MRFVFVALAVLAAGCFRSSTPAPPANKAPTPDYQRLAADELAFLPVDADIVLGIDSKAMQQSPLWHAFEPQLGALMRTFQEQYGSGCGDEVLKQLGVFTVALKFRDMKAFSGVYVMRGPDAARTLECHAQEVKAKGGTATLEQGVLVTTIPTAPGVVGVTRAIGPTTLVGQMDPAATRDTLAAVLESGTPLRGSPTFMKLYDRREQGAALWMTANGNSELFAALASTGMRPRSIDGTIVATDKLALTVRLTMAGPTEAANVASEIDKIKPMAASFVERLETRVDGAMAQLEVVVTEAQIRSLAGSLGGMVNP